MPRVAGRGAALRVPGVYGALRERERERERRVTDQLLYTLTSIKQVTPHNMSQNTPQQGKT